MHRLLLAFVLLGLNACAHHQPAPVPTEPLAPELRAWSARELPGKRSTRYSLARRAGQSCVLAQAHRSASLLRRPLHLTPAQLGQVEFDWWIAAATDLQEPANSEPVDDYPARLVLAFEGDDARLSLRNRMLFELARTVTGEAPPYATLMYVWDARLPPETVIISTHTDSVRKIVVGSGATRKQGWQRFNRDVATDFRRAFGEDPGPLVQTALMTDADNGHSQAETCYGRLLFLDRNQQLLPGSLLF